MKKVIFLFFHILFVSSCVQQMEAPESARVSGMWAVVDGNDMATQYLTFQDGYLTEFTSDRACYCADNYIWGVGKSTFKQKMRSRYSLIDGTLRYGNNVLKLIVKDGMMTMDAIKCLQIDDLNSSFYSEIVLSKANKTSFLYSDREIEWDYDIENPVEGFNLVVKEAPEWCGGVKGVTVEGNKISFSTNPTAESLSGKFVLSYLSAVDLEVEVEQSAAQIVLDGTSATFDYSSATGEFAYTIPNKQEGYELEIKADVDWIVDIKNDGDKITYSVLENNSGSARVGKIKLTYAGVSKEFVIYQQSAPMDLSASGTANSYIVSSAGSFVFKSVKGNSSTSVGAVASVSVLWESFGTSIAPSVGDLIQTVSYKDGDIYFSTSLTFKEGNAVVAAKDADGVILWSWHIWFTDAPQAQRYNDVGTMMDRNLGAVSATPGDVGALGLLYQWGRKDPFLGSSSIKSNATAKSTISWPSPVDSDSYNGTIDYATANPTVFISYNSANSDWYYTGLESTDNTRWTTSDKAKSIYDPCPAGWRVPDGGENGIWSKAFGTSSSFNLDFDDVNRGVNFGNGWVVWYPASGFRDYYGSLGNDGSYGFYWSASPYNNNACSLGFRNDGRVNPSNYNYRAYGFSVRCLQE